MEGHVHSVDCVVLSEDGSRLYSGGGFHDKTIKVWDTATNTCIETLEGHNFGVISLCLSFKTNRLISASSDKSIMVWDTTTNTWIRTVENAHKDEVTCLALFKNRFIYSGSEDSTIKVWETKLMESENSQCTIQ
jgi:WD40 repeat protein